MILPDGFACGGPRRPSAILAFSILLLFLAGSALAQPAVTGSVLGEDNHPVAGARVELLPLPPLGQPPENTVPVTVATDGDGRFTLRAPGSGMWKVVVRSTGAAAIEYAPLPLVEPPHELPPARLSAPDDGWTVVRRDSRGTPPATDPLVLSGRVVDENGRKPVAGALVWATPDPGAFVRTDAEGRFRLAAPGRRRFDLGVVAAGYSIERFAVTRPELVRRSTGTLALTRTGSLRGRVTDPKGRPLPGTMVAAIPENALGERSFDLSDPIADRTMTDAQGRFELLRLRPERSYEVRASRSGSFPAAQRATVGDPAAQPCNLTLVLAPVRAVRGRVQDPAGKPIAGAEAILRPALRPGRSPAGEEVDGITSRSDAQGTFSLPEAPAAEVELSVRKQGYAPITLPALRISSGTGPADLGAVTLHPGARLAGRVVDPGGRPVAGAEIFLLDRPAGPNDVDRALDGRKPATSSGADGRFTVDDLAQGAPVHVIARAAGFLTGQARGVRPPTTEKPVVLRLEPEALLRGRVVDEDGGPVAGARIEVRWQAFLPEDPDRPVGEPVLRGARAEADGRFELHGLPAGTARLSLSAQGFVSREGIEVGLPRPATAGELRLVLARGAILQGRVTTAAGDPVPAVRVGVGGSTAATDDDGLYWLEGAETGRQEVLFLHPSHGRLVKPVEIQPGTNALDVSFAPGVEVAGRVIDESGRPVPGARVEMEAENRFELKIYRDVSGEDGRFRLSPVADGRYQMKAEAEGFTAAAVREVIAVAGEPLSGLEITLERGATLSGNILGLPPEDLARVAVEASGERGDRIPAWTDGRGRYEVRPLYPGDWTVRATLAEGQRQAQVRLAIGRSDREVSRDLEFAKRLTLTAQVLYDEEPLPDARVSLRGQRIAAERGATTDHEGRVRFEDLEPDTYRLGVSHSRNMLVHNDQVDLQQDRDLVIRLQTATVGGLVLRAGDGEPIANAFLTMRPAEGPEFLITGSSGADGRFTLPHVQPGRYRLEARAQGFLPATQEIQAAAGQVLDTLEFRLSPAQGARLRVRLASGRIPDFVHLLVRDAAGVPVLAETRRADASGVVELSTLAAGSWSLLVRADGGALATLDLPVPSEPVTVTLAPAGRLQVRVPALVPSSLIGTVRLLGQDQQPFWTLGPGGRIDRQWPLVGGRAVIDGVPAGSWTVQVETPDGQRWQGTAVTSGSAEAGVTME